MRLAGLTRAGFYPLAPELIHPISKRLAPPAGHWTLLDPCCGKGEAIALLSGFLAGDHTTYAAELDAGRSSLARQQEQINEMVGPVDFLEMHVPRGKLACCYLNPPFNTSELGNGERVETDFLIAVTRALTIGGVLVAIVPEHQIEGAVHWMEPGFCKYLRRHYTKIVVCKLPEEHRPYNEVVVFASRKPDIKDPVPSDVEYRKFDAEFPAYKIPETPPLRFFAKAEPTPHELAAMLATSPLRRLMHPPETVDIRRPPLELGPAHVALMLVSGALDRYVHTKDPHVARGLIRKEMVVTSQTNEVDGDGTETDTTVQVEVPKPKVRAIYQDGRLETYE